MTKRSIFTFLRTPFLKKITLYNIFTHSLQCLTVYNCTTLKTQFCFKAQNLLNTLIQPLDLLGIIKYLDELQFNLRCKSKDYFANTSCSFQLLLLKKIGDVLDRLKPTISYSRWFELLFLFSFEKCGNFYFIQMISQLIHKLLL